MSKLRRPPPRAGTVRRSSLIERLANGDAPAIVSVVAPAGYGKTTLLSQWAERNDQALAWVSVDERDNDPKVLITYVAKALDAVQPVGGGVFDALASRASSVPGSIIPRLGRAFSSMTSPVVLVVDDVHLLHNRECRAALSVLADHVPDGSRLALAGRDAPPLRIARLRAEGRVLEIGPGDLSLSRAEAASLLHAAAVVLGDEDMTELHRRTEGWAAGLYLAALTIRQGGSPGSAAAAFGGDDRLVSEYVESELLARLSRRRRKFLTRTAVLTRMSGPLCDTVLDHPGSAALLADLARSNLLLVPLDRRGQWYRYHHLFRDMLLAELESEAPDLIPVLRRRAAGWHERNDLPEEALGYYMAAGDVDEVARLVERLVVSAYRQGRSRTLQRWVRWLDDRGGIERRPVVAAWAAGIAAWLGRPAEAERRADAVDRWQYGDAARPADPPAEAWAAVHRALMCRHGVKQMRADADEAARRCAAAGIVVPAAVALQGLGRILCGDLDAGDAFLKDAASQGEEVGAHETLAQTLAERSLIAMARREWGRAEDLAGQAETALLPAGTENALVCAAQARVAWHRGNAVSARHQLVRAQRARPLLTYAQPQLAVQARIELSRVHLALADLAGARTLMVEIDEILRRRPDLGTLVGEADALRAQIAKERGSSVPGASALTAAELRLLPLLTTHLSVPELAAELFLSPHTIKSRMKSIYRKLDATTRNQAVTRAREWGLLEG
jgi:LuxR family transcriptional regulator, maltose regulon positive regulatory protein